MNEEELRKVIHISSRVCEACVDVYKDFDSTEIKDSCQSIQRVWELGLAICLALSEDTEETPE